MSKERPILFSTPMVQALLRGEKTQTRRIVKQPPTAEHHSVSKGLVLDGSGEEMFLYHRKDSHINVDVAKCPYGQPGDRIWVRETFGYYRPFAEDVTTIPIYKADLDECGQCPAIIDGRKVFVNVREPWKPSIHMPKSVTRIALEIIDVRMERLHSISESDAKSEGVERWIETRLRSKTTRYKVYDHKDSDPESLFSSTAVDSFESLWKKINGGPSWDSNPWVWVVEFKRIEQSNEIS